MASRFRPPRDVPLIGQSPDSQSRFGAWLRTAFSEIAEDLARLGATDSPGIVERERLDLPAGAKRRISPSTLGASVILPCPAAENAGAESRLFIENPSGSVTVVSAPGVGDDGKIFQPTINGASRATFTLPGVVSFHSNGVNDWKTQAESPTETAETDAGAELTASLDAEYVLGSAHPSLPNGRVATDSVEIDADLASSGVISWALRAASVVLSKLQNITTQRIVGRNTAGSGSPEQITVHQALDWVTADEWGFDGSDDAVSLGNVYQKERTDSFSVSAWVKTGLPGITGVTDYVIISNADSSANNRGWSFYIHNNGTPHIKLSSVINTNDLDVFADNVAANDGQLHHLVATYAGGSAPASVQLYMDGVLLTKTTSLNSLAATIVAAGNSLRLGRFGANAGLSFPGVIKFVSVWSSVLSGASVTTLYNAGVPGNEAAVGTPQSLWKLDATDTTAASGILDYGSSNFKGTTEGGLTNAVRQGALLVRSGTDWDVLQPGAKGSALISTGGNTVPSFGTLDLNAVEPQPTNSLPVNNATTAAALVALSLSTNEIPHRAGGNIAALAVGTNTVVGRVAGNIVAAQVATGQIANNAITNALVRDSGALSVIGRSANSSGDPADISAVAASDAVLRESGSAVGFGTITTGGIANNAVTLAKLATQADDTFLVNISGGVAVPSAVALTTLAGAGLTGGADAILAVGAGTGITVNANDVAVAIPLTDGDKGDITVGSSGTTFTIDAGVVTPAKLSVLASSAGPGVVIFAAFAAGAGGAPDDVTVFSTNAPFAFRVLKTLPYVTTAVALASVQARSATAGGGSALSSLFAADVATEDPIITTPIAATTTVAANGSLFIRRSDSGIAGEFVLLAVKT